MAFLLMTKLVPELHKPRPDSDVLAWLQAVDETNLHLASVTAIEIQAGIEMSRKLDARKAKEAGHGYQR